MTVGSIMSREVFKITMDDTLATVREIFKHVKFHHLLVVEKRKLVGVISDRDLLKALSPFLDTLSERPRDAAVLNRKVHQIMSLRPVTVTKNATIEQAMRLLVENNVSCLPVVSPKGAVEGIVTWKDILRSFCDSAPAEQPLDTAHVEG